MLMIMEDSSNSTPTETLPLSSTNLEPIQPAAPHHRKRLVIITAVVTLIVGTGGAFAWYQATRSSTVVSNAFKSAVTPFKLLSTSPSKNATNVDASTAIKLNFSQPVDPAKLKSNLFITPKVDGEFKQGQNASQAVFVPTKPFEKGTKVTVMLNGTYQSNSGAKLGAPVMYGFTTSIPADGVSFEDQHGLFDNLTSLPSGQKETYKIHIGEAVGKSVSVRLYKGNVDGLLKSLVYTTNTADGFTTSSYDSLAVSTDRLEPVGPASIVNDGNTFGVEQPDGLYVAVATDDSGKEVGFSWINFSSFGVLLRQDDQKVIYSVQKFSDDTDVAATAKFYNLNKSVKLLGQKTATGLASATLPYIPSLDIVVADYNGKSAIVPVNILNSAGDIRVDRNLSTAQQVYGMTDRPTYKVGETVKLAGLARIDNDAQYSNATTNASLYVMSGSTKHTSFSAPLDSNGIFNTSFTPQSDWLPDGDNLDVMNVYSASPDGMTANDMPVASFSLTTQQNASSQLRIVFSKSDFLPTDTITATIIGTGSNGKPLANTNVELHTFAQNYYENDAAANLASFGPAVTEIKGSPTTIKLDSSGKATYTVNVASLPNEYASQKVTLEANLPNTSGTGAAGGATTIVHQGDGYLTFGTARQAIPTGSSLVTSVYASHLDGSQYTNTSLKYSLLSGDNNVLTSGTTKTDSLGAATISIPSSKLNPSMRLLVSITDSKNNVIQAVSYYSQVDQSAEYYDTSGAGLLDLNISGSSTNVALGDTVNLKIDSPDEIKAIVTYDRGRIYRPSTLSLTKGSNGFQFQVGSDLAPSFTLTFNYFLNGVYHSEGVLFNVSQPAKKTSIKIAVPSTLVANKQSALKLTTTSADGSPIASSAIVSIVSANAYDLTSLIHPSAFDALYSPRPIMTSSSSSLSAIGSGGGRCGTGGYSPPSFANALATTALWKPNVQTNTQGVADVDFAVPAGDWVVNVFTVNTNTEVENQSLRIHAD